MKILLVSLLPIKKYYGQKTCYEQQYIATYSKHAFVMIWLSICGCIQFVSCTVEVFLKYSDRFSILKEKKWMGEQERYMANVFCTCSPNHKDLYGILWSFLMELTFFVSKLNFSEILFAFIHLVSSEYLHWDSINWNVKARFKLLLIIESETILI